MIKRNLTDLKRSSSSCIGLPLPWDGIGGSKGLYIQRILHQSHCDSNDEIHKVWDWNTSLVAQKSDSKKIHENFVYQDTS